MTKKKIVRTEHLKFMEIEGFQKLPQFRNGIEDVPSILRRSYRVDQMPVWGFLRTKIWFSFKIGAINIKSLIKGTKQQEKQSLKDTIFNLKRFFKNDQAYHVPYPEFLVA
ncbi:hypothetical protein [Enterococcus sp. AZ109]|uniref:hypothetical protein n=1 Tax=Enterococcus sp. AZ109 TaxID=2774634 RepID=UPI003F2216F5